MTISCKRSNSRCRSCRLLLPGNPLQPNIAITYIISSSSKSRRSRCSTSSLSRVSRHRSWVSVPTSPWSTRILNRWLGKPMSRSLTIFFDKVKWNNRKSSNQILLIQRNWMRIALSNPKSIKCKKFHYRLNLTEANRSLKANSVGREIYLKDSTSKRRNMTRS
jgi:hypothetical protein